MSDTGRLASSFLYPLPRGDAQFSWEVLVIRANNAISAQRSNFSFDLLVAVGVYGAEFDTIGKILRSYYSCRVLEQPASGNQKVYIEHLTMIANHALLVNRTFSFPYYSQDIGSERRWESYAFHIYHDSIEKLFSRRSLGQVMGLSVPRFSQLLRLATSAESTTLLDSLLKAIHFGLTTSILSL